jgi:hypothetical protein
LPEGNYTLKFSAPDFLDKTIHNVSVTSDNTTRLSTWLDKPTGNLTGRITDADTGTPLYMVIVTPEGYIFGCFTGNDGRYILTGLPVGPVNISATSLDHGTLNFTVTILADRTITKDIQMEIISYVSTTVQNVNGDDLAGALMTLTNSKLSYKGTTNAKGVVTLTVKEGTYLMKVSYPGLDTVSETIQVDKGTMNTYGVTLASGGSVSVNVKTSGGEPIPNATVKMGNITKTTDSDGFAYLEVPTGSYTLTVTAPGYQTYQRGIKIGSGEQDVIGVPLSTGTSGNGFPLIPVVAVIIVVVVVAVVLAFLLMQQKKAVPVTMAPVAPAYAPSAPVPGAPAYPPITPVPGAPNDSPLPPAPGAPANTPAAPVVPAPPAPSQQGAPPSPPTS